MKIINFKELADILEAKGWMKFDETPLDLKVSQKKQPKRWVKNYCKMFNLVFKESMVQDLKLALKELD